MIRSSATPAAGVWLRRNPCTGLDTLRCASEREAQEVLRNHVRVKASFCRYLLTEFLGHGYKSCRGHHPALSQ